MQLSYNWTMKQLESALEIKQIRKVFGNKVAVNSIDLIIPKGSFFGLVGPNGAGKTTTLSMATGLLTPDSGGACIFGKDVWQQRSSAMELLGVLPDGLGLPEWLTGKEVLSYQAALRGLDRTVSDKHADELLEILELDREKTTLVKEYSTGMRKKIGLATALLHSPKLLVLDEPLEAVDPVSAMTIKRILTNYVENGGTVLLSSHVMALVEQLCDSVAVINKGEIVAAGTLDDIKQGKSLEEQFITLVGGEAKIAEELKWLKP
jgi:ABC-2 type transport system ATP-binding protein